MLAGFTWEVCRKLYLSKIELEFLVGFFFFVWLVVWWGFFFNLWLIFHIQFETRLELFSILTLQGPLPFCNVDSVPRQKVQENDPFFLSFSLPFHLPQFPSVRPFSSITCQRVFCT